MNSPDVVVFGATGLTGGLACSALDHAGVHFAVSGRDRDKLLRAQSHFPAASIRIADADNSAAVALAVANTKVVLNCAGPTTAVGDNLLVAALSAGAHYVDIAGDQGYLHDMYVRHESTARRAERVCLLGAGLECMLGDLAANWAAAHLSGTDPSDDVIRTSAGPPLCENSPLDDVSVSYVFDDLVLSPAGQRAVFDGLYARGLMWRRDRWDPVAPGSERRHLDAGADMGGERAVVSFPGGDVITVPRHIATARAQTFVSTSRRAATTTALRILARAMPILPRQMTHAFAPYNPLPDEYDRTQFAVIAHARRGASSTQVCVRGSNIYRTTALVAAWIVRQLVARTSGPVGMRAPSELFLPQSALAELAATANLRVAVSSGERSPSVRRD